MLDDNLANFASMPLYFLHIREGVDLLLDPEGSNHPSLEAARAEAIDGARQLISEAVLTGSPLRMHRCFQIDTADGHTLLNVPFTDAINPGEKL